MFHLPDYLHLYYEDINISLDIMFLAQYIKEMTGLNVDIREGLIPDELNIQRSLAEEFAKIKIIHPNKEELNPNPFPVEIEYEYKVISNQKNSGLFYEGFSLQGIFKKLIPLKEDNLKHLHIIFTSRLFGTFTDNRYHARVAIFSFPSLISTTGIVEAPAKPREFYLKRHLGVDPLALKEEFRESFLDYDDERIVEVMKGYLMQAFFFHLTGDPFCEDPNCRLYNAHWQKEVIVAQIKSNYEFCEEHNHILQSLKKNPK
jgi:hypothetical protein